MSDDEKLLRVIRQHPELLIVIVAACWLDRRLSRIRAAKSPPEQGKVIPVDFKKPM